MAKKTEEVEYVFTGNTSDLDSATRKVAASLGKTGRAADNASRKIDKTGDRLEGLKFAAQGAGGRVGELAGRAENFGRAFAKLGPVGGPVALAIAGVAAVGLAAIGTVAAMAKLTRAGGEAVESLSGLQGTEFGFSQDQVDRIEGANAALDGVGATMSKLVGTIAANIGPSMENLALVMVAVGLAATDAFERFTQGESIVSSALDGMGRAFAVFVRAQTGFLRAWYLIRRAMGDRGMQELESQIQGFDRLAETLDNGLSGALMDVAGNMLDLDRAQDMIDGFRQTTDGAKAAAAASLNFETALKSLQTQMVSFNADMDDRQAKLEKAHYQRLDAIDAQESAALDAAGNEDERARATDLAAEAYAEADQLRSREQAKLDAQLQDEAMARAAKVAGAIGTSAGTLSNLLVGYAKSRGDAELASSKVAMGAAKALFRVQQGMALAGIIIDANRNAVALAAPPPIGLGPIFGPAFAYGQAAVAGIAIAAQKPPAFALGGVVSADAPLAYNDGRDERHVTARPGEVILPPDALKALGGSGGTTVIVDAREQNRPLTRSRIRSRSQGRIPQSRDRQVAA